MGYGTSGLLLKPVKFKIFKQVQGIPFHAYESGEYETRKLTEIAMLRRLPKDHAQEMTEDESLPVSVVLVEESLPSTPEVPISEMRWSDLLEKAEELGVYKVGMKRAEVEAEVKKKSPHTVALDDFTKIGISVA